MFPISSDAPLYHRPWGTGGLIAANIAAFIWTGGGFGSRAETWALQFGQGLHPLQWVTHNFVHFGLDHLIGNMFFLWCFGLVVEGKIGWRRFLTLYVGIGVLAGFLLQLATVVGSTTAEGAGGASLCIYALIAIALVWAPLNEINFVVFLFYYPIWFDLPIYLVALFYIGIDLLLAWLGGFSISSAVLHVIGATLGFAAGLYMLKRDLVDCENWDLLSVLAGRHGRPSYEPYRHRTEAQRGRILGPGHRPETERTSPPPVIRIAGERQEARPRLRTVSIDGVREAIAKGRFEQAFEDYEELQRVGPAAKLPEPDLWKLAIGLCKSRRWEKALSMLREYVVRFPDSTNATAARMQLASVLLASGDGEEAARLLESIDADRLPEKWKRAYAGMRRRARRRSKKESRRRAVSRREGESGAAS
ncbi:MAG: rhomboid family intramembrane serine protease [Planctomycetes bacterium]|nr:rhomboid family intramembrane serine protease [Planctomycetota bacterium]